MAPFSLKCLSCNEYISKSRKFNARKETTKETYLGLKIYRFTIRCPRCALPIKYRTDPKTADYIVESGAVRNHISKEVAQQQSESLEETLARLEREEKESREKETKGEVDDESTAMEKLEKRYQENLKEKQLNDEVETLMTRKLINEEQITLVSENAKNQLELELDQEAAKAFKSMDRSGSVKQAIPKVQLVTSASKVTKVVSKRKKKIVI